MTLVVEVHKEEEINITPYSPEGNVILHLLSLHVTSICTCCNFDLQVLNLMWKNSRGSPAWSYAVW